MAFFTNRLIAPKNPTAEKLTSYECGEETTGNAWLPFNSRFYVIALVFLLFDVEMVFIFPWAIVFGNHQLSEIEPRWGWLALAEMFAFLGILILGLAYVWVKGDLDWIKPKPMIPTTDVNVPLALYTKLNVEQGSHKVRAFSAEPASATLNKLETADVAADSTVTTTLPPVRKPMFKPTFKKKDNE